MQTSVSPKHQATIPKRICDFLDIEAGTQIEWEIDYENRTFVGRPIEEDEEEITPEQALEELCGILKGKGSVKEFLREKREEIKREDRDIFKS